MRGPGKDKLANGAWQVCKWGFHTLHPAARQHTKLLTRLCLLWAVPHLGRQAWPCGIPHCPPRCPGVAHLRRRAHFRGCSSNDYIPGIAAALAKGVCFLLKFRRSHPGNCYQWGGRGGTGSRCWFIVCAQVNTPTRPRVQLLIGNVGELRVGKRSYQQVYLPSTLSL